MNDQYDIFFKKFATKEQFDAWFLGCNFTRGKTTSNIEVLRSLIKGYNQFASQQIRSATITEAEKNFELQKLNLLITLFDNTCSCFTTDGIHGNDNNFLYFLIGYANTLGKQNCTTPS
tara:strand:- start:175 stop:528 length:354 start_codon:yes stop_codon:yes gene_type:complete